MVGMRMWLLYNLSKVLMSVLRFVTRGHSITIGSCKVLFVNCSFDGYEWLADQQRAVFEAFALLQRENVRDFGNVVKQYLRRIVFSKGLTAKTEYPGFGVVMNYSQGVTDTAYYLASLFVYHAAYIERSIHGNSQDHLGLLARRRQIEFLKSMPEARDLLEWVLAHP